MARRTILFTLISALAIWILTGCTVVQSFMPTSTPTLTPTFTATPFPPMPTSTPTPTATEAPFFVEATVFSGELQVPILIYHRFFPDYFGPTTSTKMQFSEFEKELQRLYDAGFSLISLKSWIDGTFMVPQERKPLVITIDDLWFADQIYIGEDGIPSEYSGMGILWRFSKEHPDFGFHVVGSAIMGDKYYADKQLDDRFIIGEGDGWKDKLGNTMVWAIENGVEVYNHTFYHPRLSEISNQQIQFQLSENDIYTRTLLERVGRGDLISKLDNVIALPEGVWPATQSGKNIVLNYIDPEGKPVMAVLEAYNLDAAKFTPSYFSSGFNAFAIPRITASPYFIDFIVENKYLAPTAETCLLGPLQEEQAGDQATLQALIANAVNSKACQEGIYHINGFIFYAKDGMVNLHMAPAEAINFPEETQTTLP